MARSDKLTPEQDAQLARVGQWVIETCLLFGTQRKTAYLVAGSFIEGVEREWLTNKPVGRNSANLATILARPKDG